MTHLSVWGVVVSDKPWMAGKSRKGSNVVCMCVAPTQVDSQTFVCLDEQTEHHGQVWGSTQSLVLLVPIL